MARNSPHLLEDLRSGMADPFAQWITVGGYALTCAQARAVERALSGQQRPRRFGAFRFEFHGIEV